MPTADGAMQVAPPAAVMAQLKTAA